MSNQKQSGGDGVNNQAGRDVIFNNGLSVAQMEELKRHLDSQVVGEVQRFASEQMQIFREEFTTFQGQAYDRALQSAERLLTRFVEMLAVRAPENVESMKTVSMQHAILSAQTSAAIADDDDLTDTLVDILIDKSGSEPRSFKGVVLSEALTVANKLTTDQVNLLTALTIITRTVVHSLVDPEHVLAHLDSQCSPLYGKIPSTNTALQYMTYTGVGDIERAPGMLMGHVSIADNLVRTYDGAFTTGFDPELLPEGLKPGIGQGITQVEDRFSGGQHRYRFRIAASESLDVLARSGELNGMYSPYVDEMKKLIQQGTLPIETFMQVTENSFPDLAKFLRDLDSISAATFQLSTVGIALGQANWRRLRPEAAPSVDIWLKD